MGPVARLTRFFACVTMAGKSELHNGSNIDEQDSSRRMCFSESRWRWESGKQPFAKITWEMGAERHGPGGS